MNSLRPTPRRSSRPKNSGVGRIQHAMPISPDRLECLNEINEILERHPEAESLFQFVAELTEFFSATDIVLILRAAERTTII